jgi:hypothetical protein
LRTFAAVVEVLLDAGVLDAELPELPQPAQVARTATTEMNARKVLNAGADDSGARRGQS